MPKYFNKQLKYLNLELLDNNYINSRYRHSWKCLKCGKEFKQEWNRLQQGYLCQKCYPRDRGYSKGEKELSEYIKSFNIHILENFKDLILPYELDIYIPGKNIAIEFDGLYYHSELFKNKYYHLEKTELCDKKGIELIHIFEDEWIFKKDIVKSRLKQILGINNSEIIHTGKCKIKEINSKSKNNFLNKYHLQGEDNSDIKIGAFYNNELVSVMTFSRLKNKIYELNRFCSNYNCHTIEVASKLLTYFKKNYEWKKVYSYIDRRWNNGNLYKKIGFNLELVTKPNYWYIKNGYKKIHRFDLRKKLDEPKNIPEWILRLKEGYYRIWDCGYYKFTLKLE